jgi:integrase/recombinase XerD
MRPAIAWVTEKGVLCDHTHAADARRSRTPQLCRINHPKLSAHYRGFSPYAQKRLDRIGPDDIRRYQVYLREERKLDLGTASNYVAGLRFFYVKTLKRPHMKDDMPYPNGVKRQRRLPTILSQEEVGRLIDSSKNLFHYAMLLTIYSAGLRRSELCRLKVANIDSQRMMLRVERGKGDVDREVPISQKLLETLREYWRWMRPQTYMFPGTADGWRADKPITSKVVWEAVQQAARRAGIEKRVSPHTLRHYTASRTMPPVARQCFIL